MMRPGFSDVEPGTRLTDGEHEYIAVDTYNRGKPSHGCQVCAFVNTSKDTTPLCRDNNCNGVVWMTPIKLITLRITR